MYRKALELRILVDFCFFYGFWGALLQKADFKWAPESRGFGEKILSTILKVVESLLK